MHTTQQKLLYQKAGSFGRVIEREAFIVEGKIKQLIQDSKAIYIRNPLFLSDIHLCVCVCELFVS